jgi:hypothetical protein
MAVPVESRAPAPARPLRRRPKARRVIRRGGTGTKLTVGGAIGIGVIGVIILIRVALIADRIAGKTFANETIMLSAQSDYTLWIETRGSASWTCEVAPQSLPVMIMHGPVADPKNISAPEIQRMLAGAEQVAPGASRALSGSVGSGRFAWIVYNPNEGPTQVTIRFHAR